VKTKSLTPWCNLYLTESKYKLSLTDSCYPLLAYASAIYFLLAVTLFFIEPNVHKLSIFSFVFILYLGCFLSFTVNNHAGQHAKEFIIIDHDLAIEFSQAIAKVDGKKATASTLSGTLSAGSRVGVIGFWLNISSEVDGKEIMHNKFIFKDCLSTQDYARLSRITRLVK
jgi:hypothetical protein